MNLDRIANQLMKFADLCGIRPEFQQMIENTIVINTEEKMASQRAVDNRYGSVLVDQAERNAHGA